MRTMVFGKRALLRLPLIGGLIAVGLLMAACATPSTFPNGNNATCWTKLRDTTNETPTCEEPTEKWTDWGDVWTWSLCDSNGQTIYEMQYDASKCQTYQPIMLNEGHGDQIAQVVFGQADAGYPALFVYCVNPGQDNTLALTVRWDFGTDYTPSDTNRLVLGTNQCAAPVDVYVLTSGEFSVHIGPDAEGKVAAMVFNAPPVSNLHFVDEVVSSQPGS